MAARHETRLLPVLPLIEVPQVSTPHSLSEIGRALETAYQNLFGRPIGRVLAELLGAQIMIEAGVGKSIKNESPGNVSASAKWPGEAWRPDWYPEPTEDASARTRDLHAKMLRGEAPSAFRSFRTLDAGMADYLRTLKGTFPAILAARSPRELAVAIFESRYTRDHTPDETEPSLKKLVGQIREAGIFAHLEDPRSLNNLLEAGAFVVGLVGVIKLWGKVRG